MSFDYEFAHPYSRYGLATALLQRRITSREIKDEEVAEMLAQAIETGLSSFRFTTDNDPATSDKLHFRLLPLDELQRNQRLIQGELSAQGKYLAPTAITLDGKAKDTFENAVECVELLRAGKSLSSNFVFSRSFAPTTAKINNGRSSQSPPKGDLLETACTIITTLTPTKPAAYAEGKPKSDGKKEFFNTTIIPDLPLDEMRDFVELFQAMMTSQLDGNLYEVKLKKQPDKDTQKPATKRKMKTSAANEDATKVKSEYKRPRIFNGNYPFAPRQAAFGAAGLLAAIGRWGVEAKQTAWAERVLESIAGTKDKPELARPLYIISYDDISQAQFTHHIVKLASAGKLADIIHALTFETQVLSELDNARAYDKPAYKLFFLMANRFLQRFDAAAFRDFLSTRAEYAPALTPLFGVYFMQAKRIQPDIVISARELGQWLNRTAFFVADAEIKQEASDRKAKVQKEKAKILVEFESAAMSAKTPQDMMHRISTRAGRLLQQDAPATATRFMDATMSGEIEPQDALHLLVAYLRLRSEKTSKQEPEPRPTSITNAPVSEADFFTPEA